MILNEETLESILSRAPSLGIGVLGDLFLDRYLDIDACLSEPSLETGLDAYQVVRVRSQAGAAGTIINNLAALGVGRIVPIGVIGDDGEGYELRQALAGLPSVDAVSVIMRPDRRTPTYTKPMFCEPGEPARELNRLDIKNRTTMPDLAVHEILSALNRHWRNLDAFIVLDQVSEPGCGVVSERVRHAVACLAESDTRKFVLADSRRHIGEFRSVSLKPNRGECLRAGAMPGVEDCCRVLARQAGRPVFCTVGERGICVALADRAEVRVVAGFPAAGPIDPVGAGDSVSAALAAATSAGADPVQAAMFGNLVASITVQQIGTTGTARPDQVRQRWREVCAGGAAG